MRTLKLHSRLRNYPRVGGSPIAHSSPCTTQPEPPLREKIEVRKKKNLRAIVINFQSLKNKKPDLQLTIDNTNPDIIFGCETWLHKKIDTLEILPNNYTVYRKDRSSKGGGVLLAIKKLHQFFHPSRPRH